MLNILKTLYLRKGKDSDQVSEDTLDLIYEIKDVCSRIATTDLWFRNENDDDLIEACIYQRGFLNAQYKYLLKKIKKNMNMQKPVKNTEKENDLT